MDLAARPIDAVLLEFSDRWADGEAPRAEDYLGAIAPEDAVELIYHEFCLAEAAGRAPDPEAFLGRFPEHADRLRRLIDLHDALDPDRLPGDEPAPPPAPEPGDTIGPYRLLRELGRGAFARVFLAEQADLEHRLVVVKVSARDTPEPRLLARARHPHIVEVLRQAATGDGSLSLVCMPFLGGATLADVLAERRRRPGRGLLEALDRVAAPEFLPATAASPARELIAALPDARALAWIVARLAEALDHAHARGIAHGDLKPANVLLTADARPMLLDFNLAADGRADDARDSGGTLAYMAPERLRALADEAPPPRPADRPRADIYALGLILAEALGVPPPPRDLPHLDLRRRAAALARHRGPGRPATAGLLRGAPAALRPILARCIDPDPAARYARAAHLAEDLDRYRADRTPLYARDLPWAAACARRLRRRRRPLAAAALVLLAVTATAAALHRRHAARQAELALAKLDALWGGTEPGVFRFAASPLDPAGGPADSPAAPLRLMASYDVLGPAPWTDRPDVRALPESQRRDLEAWLAEQAWRHAAAVAAQPDATPAELARARIGLLHAPAGAPPAPLAELARRISARLGEPEPPAPRDARATSPAWLADYLAGVAAEASGRPDEALRRYRAAIAARPDSFWAYYRAAVAAGRLGDFRAAAGHLETCLARRPDHSVLPILLAGLHHRLDDPQRAGALLERAIRAGLDLDEAYRSQAYVRRSLGQTHATRGVYDRLDSLARRQPGQPRWRHLADARTLLEPTAAAAQPGAAIPRLRVEAEDHLEAHLFLACCLRDAGQPDEALAEFDRLIARAPGYFTARFIRAILLRKLGRPEAESALAGVLHDPRFGDLLVAYLGRDGFDDAARVGRYAASYALHRGRADEALEHVERGRERLAQAERAAPPGRRDELARLGAEYHFSAARVHAARAASDPEQRRAARDELDAALRVLGPEARAWFEADPVFDALRDDLPPT